MTYHNFTSDLGRDRIYEDIKKFVTTFDDIKSDITKPKGVYIYGGTGSGKTEMVKNIIKDTNMDSIWYSTLDIKNKNLIKSLTEHNISSHNIMSFFNKKKQNIVIVFDELDGMGTGEKSCIENITKLIRAKKTKKQKSEIAISNPIICIGGSKMDKKIKGIMKACPSFLVESPTNTQLTSIITKYYGDRLADDVDLIPTIVNSCKHDLRKIDTHVELFTNKLAKKRDIGSSNILSYYESFQDDIKHTVGNLLMTTRSINMHNSIITDTDRTIAFLIWHENVVKQCKNTDGAFLHFYRQILDHICAADVIDRITFQKQIWQFNEMTSLLKTFYSNYMYHQFKENNPSVIKSESVRSRQEIQFTKILTKYSNKFSNSSFIADMCETLMVDKKDLLSFFGWTQTHDPDEVLNNCLDLQIMSALEFNRMLKFNDSTTILL